MTICVPNFDVNLRNETRNYNNNIVNCSRKELKLYLQEYENDIAG